jgi:hypothetical protein
MTRHAAIPWGRVAALLAACFATLTGLVRGVDPDVILFRSVVAATLVGGLTAAAAGVFHRVRGGVSGR